MFPMTIMKRSGRAQSSSGGKDYHLVLIENADLKAIFIQRWGKARQWGNGWKLEEHPNANAARSAWTAKVKQKFNGEYTEEITSKTKIVNDLAELRKELGLQYVAKIGKALQFLIPGLDVSDLKEPEIDTEWIEQKDGTVRKRERDRKLVELPPEPVEDRAQSNTQWGIWG